MYGSFVCKIVVQKYGRVKFLTNFKSGYQPECILNLGIIVPLHDDPDGTKLDYSRDPSESTILHGRQKSRVPSTGRLDPIKQFHIIQL